MSGKEAQDKLNTLWRRDHDGDYWAYLDHCTPGVCPADVFQAAAEAIEGLNGGDRDE